MRISDINWTRGLTRLYLIAVPFWLAYWIIWIPLEGVHNWQALALTAEDKTQRQEYLAHANIIAQWRELAQDIVKHPVATVILVFLPPIVGYGVLRLLLAIFTWIARGFENPRAPNTTTKGYPS